MPWKGEADAREKILSWLERSGAPIRLEVSEGRVIPVQLQSWTIAYGAGT